MGVQRLKPSGGATIKSIQRGTIAIEGGTASNTATITSVDTARSQLSFLGQQLGGSASTPDFFGRLALTNATTITATRDSNGGTAIASWRTTVAFQVTEWQQS